jgi:hypothetical protein
LRQRAMLLLGLHYGSTPFVSFGFSPRGSPHSRAATSNCNAAIWFVKSQFEAI